MTQKELSYVEDAIKHEQAIEQICTNTINSLEDKKLKSFVQNELKIHQKLYTKLLGTLQDE